ncbi:MAG: GGDEF domain-containing protein [Candidatus Nitronauta litoralis]|uniref:diguanylate cyclase n=1 Tax=Candidatus Nitronauta litoralis TaxID=2705533 RepID=A0A7T0BUF8_9BACT|nr:MAG: GGDEF domain-containing protein [Candidatus Nitronauta litoralis]
MEITESQRTHESQQVKRLLKRQNRLLGKSLLNIDHFLYLHKSISRLNLEDIEEALIHKLPGILSVKFFSLFLYEKNKRTLTLACHNHPGWGDAKEIPVTQSNVMNDAILQGRYILEPDFKKSKYFKGKSNPLFKNHFFVCIPLMIENEILGVINLNESKSGVFSVHDLDFVLNVIEFISLSISNALLYQKTEMLSVTDGLTLLINHQQMQQILKSEFERSKRYNFELSVVMMDVDYFKKVNDTYGHQVGDQVLVALGEVISSICRSNDTGARYGGEEFCLILPQASKINAKNIAERVREEISQRVFETELGGFKVTISCGVAQLDLETMSTPADLIHVADRALYSAKKNGRDQTVVGVVDGEA